jgi:hypothetical protein
MRWSYTMATGGGPAADCVCRRGVDVAVCTGPRIWNRDDAPVGGDNRRLRDRLSAD